MVVVGPLSVGYGILKVERVSRTVIGLEFKIFDRLARFFPEPYF
jgi:hypothetical protein